MYPFTRALFAPAFLLPFLLPTLPAQQDPAEQSAELKQIVEKVDQQLKEIDQLLLESAKRTPTEKKPKQLLTETHTKSEQVVQNIEELIKKLEEMKSQSQQQQQQQDEHQKQQQQGEQQQPPKPGEGQNRHENPTPDFVPQDSAQKQAQSQPKSGDPKSQPTGEQHQKSPGQNEIANRPPESETEKTQPGTGDQSWGELQSYVNFVKNRGSAPKVPEKFRKYWDAYLKSKAKKQ